MRQKAAEKFAQNPCFVPVNAPAENTGLDKGCVDLVCAASAFHWFDPELFKKEIRRILRPGGCVCILINAREYDDFTKEQHLICQKYCKGFSSLAHGLEKTRPAMDRFFENGFEEYRFDFPLEYSRENFVKRSLSSSYAPGKDDPSYEPYKEELIKLMDRFCISESIIVKNTTVIFVGRV